MIGDKLKDIRDNNNFTQKEMAEILGVYKGHYSNWENNKELIPLKKLNLLCNYFNVSMDYVIGLTREKFGNGSHELNSKIIGINLRKIRRKFNLTQTDLAKELNTSQSTISAYESGETILLTAFALQIVKKYNTSLDWILGRSNNKYLK